MGRRTRMKNMNSSVMRAIAEYVHRKPATVGDIVENATFKSGKALRSSRMCMTTRQLASTLAGHKDFYIFHRANDKAEGEWGIDPKSKLLVDFLDRKDTPATAAKKKRLGNAAYQKQLKARRKAPSYHRPTRGKKA